MSLSYFFEARVQIANDDWQQFLDRHQSDAAAAGVPDAGALIVKLLEGAGLELVNGAVFGPAEGFPYRFFYNVWKIGENANGLADAERALADKVIWARFIKLLSRVEDKDFIYPITDRTQNVRPTWDFESSKYVRVHYDMKHYAIAEIKARLDAELAAEGRRVGWYDGSSYLTHSGREGRLIQFWRVPGTTTQEEAVERVQSFKFMRDYLGKPILITPNPDVRCVDRSNTFDPLP